MTTLARIVARGQVSGIDFMFALVAFSIIFSMYSAWAVQVAPREGSEEPAFILASARQMLFEGPGIPAEWNSTNVKVPGIVRQRMVIDNAKLAKFLALNYSQKTSLLGAAGYDFYFDLEWTNGTVITSTGLNGTNRSTSAQSRSLVVYNGTAIVSNLRLSR